MRIDVSGGRVPISTFRERHNIRPRAKRRVATSVAESHFKTLSGELKSTSGAPATISMKRLEQIFGVSPMRDVSSKRAWVAPLKVQINKYRHLMLVHLSLGFFITPVLNNACSFAKLP